MNTMLAIRIALIFGAGWIGNAVNDRYAPWGAHATLEAEREEVDRLEDALLAEQLKNRTLDSQKAVLESREQAAAERDSSVAASTAVRCAADIERAFRRGAQACSAILPHSGS